MSACLYECQGLLCVLSKVKVVIARWVWVSVGVEIFAIVLFNGIIVLCNQFLPRETPSPFAEATRHGQPKTRCLLFHADIST